MLSARTHDHSVLAGDFVGFDRTHGEYVQESERSMTAHMLRVRSTSVRRTRTRRQRDGRECRGAAETRSFVAAENARYKAIAAAARMATE
jgi:hypothetical protein